MDTGCPCNRVTSLNPGTEGNRLGLLRSRPDPVGRTPMRGGPSPTIVSHAAGSGRNLFGQPAFHQDDVLLQRALEGSQACFDLGLVLGGQGGFQRTGMV